MASIKELNDMLNNGLDVYRYYIHPEIRLKSKIISPLRKETDPSFSIYPHRASGEVYFSDHGSGVWGNHWTFVQEMFGLDFKDAIEKVKVDILKISKNKSFADVQPVFKMSQKVIIPTNDKTILKPSFREWSINDLKFWDRFKISKAILEQHNVRPAFSYQIIKGSHSFQIYEHKENPIYVITYPSGNMKIYRPLEPERRYKWISNTDSEDDIFGFPLLPNHSDCIFLIGGNKDVMSFKSVIGHPAVSLRSESSHLTDSHFTLLKHMSEKLIVFYDNDTQGYKKAAQFYDQFAIVSCNHLLKPYNVKDFAQLVDEQPESISEFNSSLSEYISMAYNMN